MDTFPINLSDPYLSWSKEVLASIRNTHPLDFDRLQSQVIGVELLIGTDGLEARTLGLWMSKDLSANAPGNILVRTKCRLGRRLNQKEFKTVLAHELGHACGAVDEEQPRNAPNELWARETVADMYVYKWGFAGLIKGKRTTGMSEGLKPGRNQMIEEAHYRLSQDFVWMKTRAPGERESNVEH